MNHNNVEHGKSWTKRAEQIQKNYKNPLLSVEATSYEKQLIQPIKA